MRVLVLGGTRFIGLALVRELLGAGHSVAVVHRGEHEPEGLRGVEHFHLDRRELGQLRQELARFKPDVVIDMSAMASAEAAEAAGAFDPAIPTVVASSCDVYRAYEGVMEGRVTDSAPLAEDAALREGPPPDRDVVLEGWTYDAASYEKLDVERAYLERGAVVCRLPMVYGEFLWSRGYAPEIARGLRLAAESGLKGEVFNLAEPECAPIRAWVEQILLAADSDAELVRVPDGDLPEDLLLTGEIPQPWWVDTTKAATRLGWVHEPWRGCVERSVRWHLEHPPEPKPGDDDFSADDTALRRS